MDPRSIRNAPGTAASSAPAQTQPAALPALSDLDEPTFWQRHRALRWALPLFLLGALATGSTQLSDGDSGHDPLPATTPEALLAAVRSPAVAPYSGTVVSRLSSDLPQLSLPGDQNSGMTGSHTMRVWYGGPQQQRISVLAATTETDVFRDGSDVWHWNTGDAHAVHATLPAAAPAVGPVPTSGDPLALTPQALATQALNAVDASTIVVVGAPRTVADRPAYDLVITPNAERSKIGSVRISVDGARMVPLAVQVFARGEDTPAVDVAFTGISFRRPGDANFRFAPPSGVSVRELSASGGRVAGSGWTSVYGYPGAAIPLSGPSAVTTFVSVSGTWGTGQLFECDLMSMLVTRDGTVFVGTVEPAQLYAAAGAK